MEMFQKLRAFVIKAYRVWISYDLPLIAHMVWNRLRYRHYLDYLKADWPYKFQFLRRHYGHILEKCRQNPVINKPNEGPIWVCWWQGEQHMPEIVRMCYASLKKHAPSDRPLIFLHAGNYHEYADIPKYILDKLDNKVMTITHFTDILRMELLAKHGGLWIDATVFLSSKMPDCVFKHPYFSAKEPFNPDWVWRSEYTLFMIGAAAAAPWVVFARDVLFQYWKTSYMLLDYALIAYILTMALDSIPEMREEVMKGSLDTPHINTLQNRRNDPCDFAYYDKMMSECSFYKLTYKLVFREIDEESKLTYYGKMKSELIS